MYESLCERQLWLSMVHGAWGVRSSSAHSQPSVRHVAHHAFDGEGAQFKQRMRGECHAVQSVSQRLVRQMRDWVVWSETDDARIQPVCLSTGRMRASRSFSFPA